MKKIFTVFALFLTAISFSACGSEKSAQDGKIKVVATIFPIYDWTREIIGEDKDFDLMLLMDKGVDLHSFQPSAEDKKLSADNMERLGISTLAHRCFRELSGGQKQRVLLARALCAARKILLLDEPIAGLDPQAADDMYKIISELNRSGITIIIISHDVDEAIKHATHVLHLGEKIFFGASGDYHA